MAVLLLSGCSPKIIPGSSDSHSRDSIATVYIEKPVPVPMPADSAVVEALLKCDEHGEVLLQSLTQEASRNSRLQFELDSLGRLIAKFKTAPDTIYVPVSQTETHTDHESQSSEVQIVEVPADLNGFQKFFIWFGIACLAVLISWIAVSVYRRFRR